MNDIYLWKSSIGVLKLCAENDHITGLSLLQKETEPSLLQTSIRHSDLLYEAYTQLQEYFAGKRTQFELPIHNAGTAFQQRVWQELRQIPYGETRSYQELAVAIGNPKACRAVGQANNKNPLLIINPCHRVIHKNGDITGFGCGIEVKQFLLDLEKTDRAEP
ncbi:MAG: methylated-DNA--[protein]-cysteine S-methyltransferase [Lachnospiraceae bacterium]|nr:methylated-DNA--[protein]-cysteine S-methyltransferase [Lachnospiraceae bacterium]